MGDYNLSSSDDDDEDLLNSQPMFRKQTRSSIAKERKKFNFLDSILDKEQARKDRKDRIDNLMHQTDDEEEEQEEEGKSGSGSGEEKKSSKNGGTTEGEKMTTDGVTSSSTDKASRAVQQQQQQNLMDTSSLSEKTSSSSNAPQCNPTNTHGSLSSDSSDANNHNNNNNNNNPKKKRKRKKNDLDDVDSQSYWSRIDSHTRQESGRGTAGVGRENNVGVPITSEERRRRLNNVLEGIEEPDHYHHHNHHEDTHNRMLDDDATAAGVDDKKSKLGLTKSNRRTSSSNARVGAGGDRTRDKNHTEQATATTTSTRKSTHVGSRHVFHPSSSSCYLHSQESNEKESKENRHGWCWIPFTSIDEAMEQLTIKLNQWMNHRDNNNKNSGSAKNRSAPKRRGRRPTRQINTSTATDMDVTPKEYDIICTKIIQPMQRALKANLLSKYLQRLHWPYSNDDDILPMPKEIVQWLLRMGLSVGNNNNNENNRMDVNLCMCAQVLILRILKAKAPIIPLLVKDTNDGDGSNGSGDTFLIDVEEFVPMLQREFGLVVPTQSNSNSTTTNEEETMDLDLPELGPLENEFGLKFALEVWSIVLDYDYVSTSQNDNDDDNDDSKERWMNDVANNIAMTIRCSLDPLFIDGQSLMYARNALISSFLNWTPPLTQDNKKKLKSFQSNHRLYQNETYHSLVSQSKMEFLHLTAQQIIQAISNLPPNSNANGLLDAEDDERGWLPLAVSARIGQDTFHTNLANKKDNDDEDDGVIATDVTILFAMVSSIGLQKCLFIENCQEWSDEVDQVARTIYKDNSEDGQKEESQDRIPWEYKYMATAEIVLSKMKNSHSDITKDAPRFLATVDMAATCSHMGMRLYHARQHNNDDGHEEEENGVDHDDDDGGNTAKQKEEKGQLHHFVRLEKMCNVLRKNILCVFINPNFRRVKELLAYLVHFYKLRGSDILNQQQEQNKKRQSSLIGWCNDQNDSDDSVKDSDDSE